MHYLRLWLWKIYGFRLGESFIFREASLRTKLEQKKWRYMIEKEYEMLRRTQS